MFSSARMSFVDKVLFTKHMSVMIKAGVPLAEALEALMDSGSSGLASSLKKVVKQVRDGSSLADSLKSTKMFDAFFINLIAVGEKSGTLEDTLGYLSLHLQKEYAVRKKIQGAMAYPVLVLALALGFSAVMSIFVLPRFVSFFDAFSIDLPLTTKILVVIATFMKEWGVLFFSVLIGLIIFVALLIRFTGLRYYWHWLSLRFPIFGKVVLFGQLENFSRNVSTMLKSGIPIVESLEITAGTLSNTVLAGYVQQIVKEVEKGSTLADSVEKYWKVPASALLIRMLSVGEKSGNLEETLSYLANFYEEELESVTKNLTTLLEPILLLSVGLIVGFIAIAIISPIYELTGSIRRGG